MKRVKRPFLLSIAILFTALFFGHIVMADDDADIDEFKIYVSDVKVKESKLKAGDKLKLSLKAAGNGNATIRTIDVSYQSEKGQGLNLDLKYNSKKKIWSANFKIPKGIQNGCWKIVEVRANRESEDTRGYFWEDSGDKNQLSPGNIKISGTKADYTRPNINIKSLKSSQKGRQISYRVKVNDKSPIKNVMLNVFDSESKRNDYIYMKYNKKKKIYQISKKFKKGTYHIYSITASDIWGNEITYHNKDKKVRSYSFEYDWLVDFSKHDQKIK